MNKRSYGSGHLRFLLAGIIAVFLLDRFVLGGTRPYIEDLRQNQSGDYSSVKADAEPRGQPASSQAASQLALARLAPKMNLAPRGNTVNSSELVGEAPLWRKNAVPWTPPEAPAYKIAIIIDDMGVARGHSRQIIALQAPLTLSFLPYAGGLADMVREGRSAGHEIMVHMPMEPESGGQDLGEIYLSAAQGDATFRAMLEAGLTAFDGYVGINNHMGSKLTRDKTAMRKVMATLKERGALFVDSRTIGDSVAARVAAEYGVPFAVRDVFIDHVDEPEAIAESLKKIEKIAARDGMAVAIGHPRPATIAALGEWLPGLRERGFELVPISAVVTVPGEFSAARALVPPPQAPVPLPR